MLAFVDAVASGQLRSEVAAAAITAVYANTPLNVPSFVSTVT